MKEISLFTFTLPQCFRRCSHQELSIRQQRLVRIHLLCNPWSWCTPSRAMKNLYKTSQELRKLPFTRVMESQVEMSITIFMSVLSIISVLPDLSVVFSPEVIVKCLPNDLLEKSLKWKTIVGRPVSSLVTSTLICMVPYCGWKFYPSPPAKCCCQNWLPKSKGAQQKFRLA